MNIISQKITLDFSQSDSYKTLHVKQYDKASRNIIISLTNNGIPVPLSSSDTAKLYASTNGVATATGTTCTIDVIDNTITVPITENLTELSGVERCEVEITRTASNNSLIHTANFNLLVGACAVNADTPGYLPSTSILEQIAQLRNDLDALTEQVDDINVSITDITDNISTIQGNVSTLTGRVDTLEVDLAALTSRVARLEYAVAYLTNIPWALSETMNPEYEHRIITAAAKSLPKQGAYQYYDLIEPGFDYTVDGLVLYHDGGYGYILPDRYTLSEISGGVRILFNGTGGSVSVQGELSCHLFIKPREEESSE